MTLTVLAITVIALIIYDIVIAITRGTNETISWQGWLLAQKYPIVVLALGIVLGHILWHNCG